MKAKEYTNNLVNALIVNYRNTTEIYCEKEGCHRLAREYGVGLRDFNVEERIVEIDESYYSICSRFYQLNTPIKYNEWTSIVYQYSNM